MNRLSLLVVTGLTLCACASRPSAREEAKALFEQGNVALRQNHLAEAIASYQLAADVDPQFAMPHRGLGIAHARAGEGDAAVGHYKAYLQLFPNAQDADAVYRIIADYGDAVSR